MIYEASMNGLTFIFKTFVNAFNVDISFPDWSGFGYEMISVALYFFPADIWYVAFSNLVLWIGIHMIIAIVEFVIRKIGLG